MTSVITDRFALPVDGGPGGGGGGAGIHSTLNVAGTNDITADVFPLISGLQTNMWFSLRPFAINTGAIRLNLGASGLVACVKPGGADFAAGEFNPALLYLINFDGTKYTVQSPSF